MKYAVNGEKINNIQKLQAAFHKLEFFRQHSINVGSRFNGVMLVHRDLEI